MNKTNFRIYRSAGIVELLVLLATFLTIQPQPLRAQEHDEEHTRHDHGEEREEVVRLGEADIQEFGIVLSEAGPATLEQILELPGEIQANDTALAHIAPRFSGIVTDVRREGNEIYLQLSVGATSDVKEGMKFIIYGKGGFKGDMLVTKVYPDYSFGRLVARGVQDPVKGDRATTRLPLGT